MTSENQDNIEGKLEKLRRYGKKEEKDKIPEDVYLKTEKSKAPDDEKSLEETETREAVSEYERLYHEGKVALENGDIKTARENLLEVVYKDPRNFGSKAFQEVVSKAVSTEDEDIIYLAFDLATKRNLKNRDNLLEELVDTYIKLPD